MERNITWQHIRDRIELKGLDKSKKYYGVPRGGQPIAAMLNPVDRPEEADIIIDDLIDSGATQAKYILQYPNTKFIALFNKQVEFKDDWLKFPWEQGGEVEIEENVKRIIQYFDNSNREGLIETPKRYIKFLKEFLSPPKFNFTAFEKEGYDEIILVKDIPFHSLCEHHLAPFYGIGHIAYIPNKKIIGISKLPRTLDMFSRRFQNQERITTQVAELLMEKLNAKGVAVVLEAEHMCMSMRGVKKHNTTTKTSKMIGVFKEDHMARSEFMSLINSK